MFRICSRCNQLHGEIDQHGERLTGSLTAALKHQRYQRASAETWRDGTSQDIGQMSDHTIRILGAEYRGEESPERESRSDARRCRDALEWSGRRSDYQSREARGSPSRTRCAITKVKIKAARTITSITAFFTRFLKLGFMAHSAARQGYSNRQSPCWTDDR